VSVCFVGGYTFYLGRLKGNLVWCKFFHAVCNKNFCLQEFLTQIWGHCVTMDDFRMIVNDKYATPTNQRLPVSDRSYTSSWLIGFSRNTPKFSVLARISSVTAHDLLALKQHHWLYWVWISQL